ncbi:MAG: hypothetical protein AB1898_16840 [Acidobacteriota bacterium]
MMSTSYWCRRCAGSQPVILSFAISLLVSGFLPCPLRSEPVSPRLFIFSNASRSLDEFRAVAKVASRLKRYGRVQVDIGALADKAWHELPKDDSPWHEYASWASTTAKFFPHPKISPFFPSEWIAQNRTLLLAKAAILREMGLEAAFSSKSSFFLPEAFFQQYPHLRGPRVDHPRRSKQEEFSWCVDLEETREMIEWMTAELRRHVPEIRTILEKTNDAGSGLCWAAALYSGPNGPGHCRHRNAGERVRDLSTAIHRGAEKHGGKVDVRFISSNFWQNEEDVILPLLPPNTYIDDRDPGFFSVGTLINDAYPVLGLLNPLSILTQLERLERPELRTLWIRSTAMYARADDLPNTLEKVVDLVEDSVSKPVRGLMPRLDKLRTLAARWGGERNAEKLLEAFVKMDEAFSLKQAVAPGYNNFYCGVSMRHLTRPLLIKPELLTPDDESYFLPYVFNIHESEARSDYIDLHGSRMKGLTAWNHPGLRRSLQAALGAAATMDHLKNAPEETWFRQLAQSLRMWVSEVRSIHAFYSTQVIRDRNAELLSGLPRRPEKIPTWTGDPDFLEWSQIQRDEYDNANELLTLLKDGGIRWVARADNAKYEDTFLLGPSLVEAVKKKIQVMRLHWLDSELYLTPPHK